MSASYIRSPVALVVNGHYAVRRALCERIKASFADFRLREAANVEDALYILDEEQIDVVVIDGASRGIGGVKGTRAILERSPASSVIVMSSFNDATCRSGLSGAMAFVSTRAIGSELMQVLEEFAGKRRSREPRDAF